MRLRYLRLCSRGLWLEAAEPSNPRVFQVQARSPLRQKVATSGRDCVARQGDAALQNISVPPSGLARDAG